MGIKTAREILGKTPDETARKAFDFAGDDLSVGEVISTVNSTSATPTGDANDLIVSGGAITGATTINVTLTKGRVGFTYAVHVKITTNFGQVLEACGRIRIGEC
jgi:hypothetical protein